MSTSVLAVVLAVLAATCFAAAAVAQHDALSGAAGTAGRRLSLTTLVSLAARPRWLAGAALAAAGVALHAGALTMAPLSVVQPVGVLAVPLAIAAVFARSRSRPPRGVVLGSALTVAGVTGFVVLAGPTTAATPWTGGVLLLVGAAVTAVVAVLAVAGLSRRGPLRTVGCAAAAAVAFGFVSVLLRTLLSHVGSGDLGVLDPGALALLGGMAAAALVGGWLAQQALASGAAAVALSVLTVLDPVVAVALGALVGDGGPATWVWPLLAVVPAITGVLVLTRHHPAVVGTVVADRPSRAGRPARAAGALDLRAPGSTPAHGARRVVIGADTFPPDVNGAARFAGRLAGGLAARGHEVHVVAPSLTGPAGTDRVGAVTVHHLRSHAWPGRPQLRFCLPWQVRRSAAGLVDRLDPDVVHVQGHFPVCRALLVRAGRRGIPVVATNHVVPDNFLVRVPRPFRAIAAAWFWEDLVRVLGRATVVTAPTRVAVELLERAGLAGALPVSNGTDLPAVGGRTTTGAGRDGAEPTVLFVGRLDREKHVEDLLRALAAHGGEQVPRVEVVGDGPCRGAWTALAASLGVAARVSFLGHLDEGELAAARERAGVFVMPGTAELQSLATLEAMAVGLPVVAADAMALPHLVRPGVNGWLYRPGDANALADRIAEVLADPAARARMGAASAAIAGDHDVSRTLETFEALYDGVLARPARPARPAESRDRVLVPSPV